MQCFLTLQSITAIHHYIYSFADEAERAVIMPEEEVADLIGAKKDEIYFTGGGSESDNWALMATAEAYAAKGKHIITSAIEHHAIFTQHSGLISMASR